MQRERVAITTVIEPPLTAEAQSIAYRKIQAPANSWSEKLSSRKGVRRDGRLTPTFPKD